VFSVDWRAWIPIIALTAAERVELGECAAEPVERMMLVARVLLLRTGVVYRRSPSDWCSQPSSASGQRFLEAGLAGSRPPRGAPIESSPQDGAHPTGRKETDGRFDPLSTRRLAKKLGVPHMEARVWEKNGISHTDEAL
jgi:hypothetical protein